MRKTVIYSGCLLLCAAFAAAWLVVFQIRQGRTDSPFTELDRIDTLDLAGHKDELACAAFSADGKRVATGCFDKVVRVFDVTTGALVATFPFGDDVNNAPDDLGMRIDRKS